jgi:hypothetical protein
MTRKTGQIIRCGFETWMVRIYVGRDPGNPETQVHRQSHSPRPAGRTGPRHPHACRVGPRP